MGFKTESDMKETAVESLPGEIGNEAFEVVPEFDYGPGRTDLVFVNVSRPYWNRRINRLDLDKPIQDKKKLITFLQLHGRGEVTKEYFYQLGALKRRYKRESLDWLMENDFIVETCDDKIRTTRNLRRHITTTVAVELKLRKWREALKQASRGRSFAEYKYVVLDHHHVDSALSNLHEFKSSNIGLISIDDAGNCYRHHDPSRGAPHSDLYKWKLNELSLNEKSA